MPPDESSFFETPFWATPVKPDPDKMIWYMKNDGTGWKDISMDEYIRIRLFPKKFEGVKLCQYGPRKPL